MGREDCWTVSTRTSLVWLAETALSHPSLTGARAYFDDSGDGVVRLFRQPHYGRADDPNAMSPYMAFHLLFLGVGAFNQLMVGEPWSVELTRIGEAGGFTAP
ncbi:hypothetical protein ACIBL6_20120 [Streptomyces sp. NPDC050400]|uniref:hypothetical protein n=1 Tax=Streptomyces sp. NPDC050400 TaxID=3365610 RepID=UPI0037ACAC4A